MPGEEQPAEPQLDEIAARLTEGLASCRSVVENYKSLMSAEPANPDIEQAKGEDDAGQSADS